ncbi:MAG: hypothetical protein LBL83_05590, partial [Clostridiales bacterium]|nr:hypothetical protein [Clostridiales bacterium]
MRKFGRKALAALLAAAMLAGMIPAGGIGAFAASHAAFARTFALSGASVSGNVVYADEDNATLTIPGWPAGYEASSLGWAYWYGPEPTDDSFGDFNSILFDEDAVSYDSAAQTCTLTGVSFAGGVDETPYGSYTIDPVPLGTFRLVLYAYDPLDDNTDGDDFYEDLLYSDAPIYVEERTLFNLAGTTLSVTGGGELSAPAQLTLRLDLGTGGGPATVEAGDNIYLDVMDYGDGGNPEGAAADFAAATLASPAGFAIKENNYTGDDPVSIITINPQSQYVAADGTIDFVIDNVYPLAASAVALVKMDRPPDDPSGFYTYLGHWQGGIIFSGGGGDPGDPGDPGLASVRAVFTQDAAGKILADAPYHLYAYTSAPLAADATAAATLHYVGTDNELYTIVTQLTPTRPGTYTLYAQANWPAPASLASPVARVVKVVFAYLDETREQTFGADGKDISSSARVTFAGEPNSGVFKYLRLKDSEDGETLRTQFVGYELPPEGVSIAGLDSGTTYYLDVYGSQYGKELVYGSGSFTAEAGAAPVELTLTAKSITRVTPAVTPSNYAYGASIYWYGDAAGDNLISIGPSYDLIDGEAVWAKAVPSYYNIRYIRESGIAPAEPGMALALGQPTMGTVAGVVTRRDGTTPVANASIAVSCTVSGQTMSY